MSEIRYGSVCSGVEAASLAWGKLGWKPVFFAEVEPFPCAVLQQRFNATKPLHPLDPAEASDEKDRKMRESWLRQINKLPDTGIVPNLGDFTKIKGQDYVGAVDLLVGGTPCQDLSVAGKRAGFGDIEKRDEDNAEKTRSSLALDFVRLAYEAKCRFFLWENVPGAFSSNGGRDFATLLSWFVGYRIEPPRGGWKSSGLAKNRRPDRFGVAWRVLDAQFTRVPGFPFAVPQRRRRVFALGCLGDWERAAAILLEPDRLSWDTPPRIRTRETLARDTGAGSAQTVRMRAGCDGGGKGALIGDNLSHTLQTGNDQTLVEFAEESANCLEASSYKGPAGTWNERTIVSQFWDGGQVAGSVTCSSNNALEPDKGRLQAVIANGASYGGREMDEISGPVTTHESGVRGDMKLVVGSFMGGQGAKAGSIGYSDELSPSLKAQPSGGNQVPDVVCFQQNARDEVRQMNGDGAIAGALAAEQGMKQQNYVCYDGQGRENGAISGTLTGDHNNRVTDFAQLAVSPTLEAKMYIKNQLQDASKYQAVAIAENVIGRQAENGGNGIGAQEEIAYTQNATGVMGVCQKTVRRLTPIEAERLMGHPDNHTRISWQGKPEEECPDAPRYKAEGNSMAANCMEWIGRRIEEFEE